MYAAVLGYPVNLTPVVATIRRTTAIVGALVFVLSGCASQSALKPRKDLLDFLIDGSTMCSELSDRLGSPSGSFEDGRLLTYKFEQDGKQRLAVVAPGARDFWSRTNKSLVITCGHDGIVARHTLVAVKQEANKT